MTVSDADFRAAMGSFGSGIVVVTTVDAAGTPYGFTATSFASVSRNPPLCLVCPGHSAEALPTLRAVRRFGVSILERSQEAISARFAMHGVDKFDGISVRKGPVTGCPLISGALATLECDTEATLVAGDHDVFIGRILHIELGSGEPLLYFRGRYREFAAT